jgi:hypothetical protein
MIKFKIINNKYKLMVNKIKIIILEMQNYFIKFTLFIEI